MDETRLGVADVEQVLADYWRTNRARTELRNYGKSEEYRRKEAQLAELERELAGQRFSFFQRRRTLRKIQEKREELEALAAEEARRVNSREKTAIEELLSEVRRAAGSIGSDREHVLILDSNEPHILFLNSFAPGIEEVTNEVIEELNSR